MKNQSENFDWIDDPFNDKKQKEAMDTASESAHKTSCLLVVAVVTIVIGIAVIAGIGFLSTINAL